MNSIAGPIRIAHRLLVVFAALCVATLLATPAVAAENGRGRSGDDAAADDRTVTEDDDGDGVANSPDPEGDSDNQHPSGKDKHEEAGRSGNQGKATSNPDNDGRGPERNSCEGSGQSECVDQPGGDGGEDQLDQDGNNGCGNDDDFEDDNEGWCGRNPARNGPDRDTDAGNEQQRTLVQPQPQPQPQPERESERRPARSVPSRTIAQQEPSTTVPTDVRGVVIERPSTTADVTPTVETEVLGVQLTRAAADVDVLGVTLAAPADAAPTSLARTGTSVGALVAALALIAAGAVAVRASRRPTSD